ncbi:MAG: bacillithiol system redox-active protein YtxJ [Saprospiraceae bacterium]
MTWNPLDSLTQVDHIVQRSYEVPCLVFKHSTRCSISFMAKMRLESNWGFSADQLEPYFLDLIAFRTISNEMADRFSVHHESPQILLIKDGECILDASHMDISVDEIQSVLPAVLPHYPN